jgi:hypothetical protein
VFRIFLRGTAQVGVLAGACTLCFRPDWGNLIRHTTALRPNGQNLAANSSESDA